VNNPTYLALFLAVTALLAGTAWLITRPISRYYDEAKAPEIRGNLPFTNRQLLERLQSRLLGVAAFSRMQRNHRRWQQGMERATGKRFA
jgi:hypothetical protein